MSKRVGIEPLFSDSDIDRWFDIFEDKAEIKMRTLLQAAGEMFVRYARLEGNYIDHTGNLRSSIGYVIVEDGDVKEENFQIQHTGTEGDEGKAKGRKLAKNLANTYNVGMVLIGVAGMEYAVYVEALESKDVITAANIKAEAWMKKAIRTVFRKA